MKFYPKANTELHNVMMDQTKATFKQNQALQQLCFKQNHSETIRKLNFIALIHRHQSQQCDIGLRFFKCLILSECGLIVKLFCD